MELKDFLEINKQLNTRSFGEFIRQRRIELGYSARKIADFLEVTPSYVADIEKGNRHAPLTLLKKLATALLIEEELMSDFIDLAYLSHETCSPDLIQYLIASKEARSALRHIIENNVSGREFLEVVTNNVKNIEK